MSENPAPWRSTPPAIFPICLALLGLALAWRNAALVLPVWQEIGMALSGLAAIIYLFFLSNYLRKILARPRVLLEDTATAPARAGIATIAMAMLLLAAVLLPFGQIAMVLWWIGLIMQAVASGLGVWAIWRDPAETRQFSAFQYLTFVGPVVSIPAGVALGYTTLSMVLLLATFLAYLIMTFGLIQQLRRALPPEPLRPSMTIFLAPLCLFASGFEALGLDWAFDVFYWLSLLGALVLVVLIPWMIKGGFNPVWSSFTFPLAAFLQMLTLAQTTIGGDLLAWVLVGSLAIGTPIILIISLRVMRLWASGGLAIKTGAATA